jgi:hypothetical protein
LFFDCVLARFIWRTIELTFGLKPPMSIGHISTSWLQNIPLDDKKLILVVARVKCWSIWLSRNDAVFNKSHIFFYACYFQGYTLDTHMVFVSKGGKRNILKSACRIIETLTMYIFIKHGWRFNNRSCY